jgi:hypothetical protein
MWLFLFSENIPEATMTVGKLFGSGDSIQLQATDALFMTLDIK